MSEHGNTCRLCSSQDIHSFYEFSNIPTMDGRLSESKEGALTTVKGDIRLVHCHNCGFVENIWHDASKVSFDAYDYSPFHSPIFADFLENLASRLIEKYDLRRKSVLELGCGDGYVLKRICEKGRNKGIGIDPGFEIDPIKEEGYSVEYIRDYYSEKYNYIQPDFVFCRHVLNALPDLVGFIKTLRKNMENRPDNIGYFEVPNTHHTIGDQVLWNIVYEHKSWFTPASLAYLFRLHGFDILNVSPCWNEEFLGIEVRPSVTTNSEPIFKEDISLLTREIEAFQQRVDQIQTEAEKRVKEIQEKKLKVIMWGAGARGISFLNRFPLNETVQFVIDINPLRQGKFMPGTGHEVVSPFELPEIRPDLIIINNPTYEAEIKNQAKEYWPGAEFWVLK